ncbi:MAG: hypothetical protein H0W35_04600 [Actinobacteria bacterium]|nr:hypothetical protein [Actinomycetota bacterium]MBA3561984.1 hypothetical protein [Actinomycetota bacterium]MBA3566125.1 hypothetical protein [Actinomycetota bacterium]MDQ3425542.1 hypothetical protein [Actinomycetota bacterium]
MRVGALVGFIGLVVGLSGRWSFAATSQVFEWWNGKGAPKGLKGEDIALAGRVAHARSGSASSLQDR